MSQRGDDVNGTDAAWRRRHAVARAKNLLECVRAPKETVAEIDAAGDVEDVQVRLARALAVAAEDSPNVDYRRMAHAFLAELLARRGDPEFFTHLRGAARCQLERISSLSIGVDVVDIVPGCDEPFCLSMRRDSVALGEMLRASVIPNIGCPRRYGRVERSYCTCRYEIARAWFNRRR